VDVRSAPVGDTGLGRRGRGPDLGGSGRAPRQAAQGQGRGRSAPSGDLATLARLRSALDGGEDRSRWPEIAIIVGTAILAACIILTTILAAHIDARANRIVTDNDIRATAGLRTIQTFTDSSERIEHKLDDLLALHTTTTTVGRRTATATTLRPVPKPIPPTPAPVSPATTTTRPAPPPSPPTTTCKFLLVTVCVIR
jgi:hypothetical protein